MLTNGQMKLLNELSDNYPFIKHIILKEVRKLCLPLRLRCLQKQEQSLVKDLPKRTTTVCLTQTVLQDVYKRQHKSCTLICATILSVSENRNSVDTIILTGLTSISVCGGKTSILCGILFTTRSNLNEYCTFQLKEIQDINILFQLTSAFYSEAWAMRMLLSWGSTP